MAFRFPLTIKAAQGGERNQWDFARALLAECGPPGKDRSNNGSEEKLEAARDELTANGLLGGEGNPYNIQWLRHCRDTAHAFPHVSQETSVSFRVHMACGTPAMLKAVLKAWTKEKPGERLALHACTRLLAEINRQREAAWEKKHAPTREVAKAEHEKALLSVTVARARKLAANSPAAREAAEAEIKKAQRAAERAAEKIEESKLPPQRDPSAVPSEKKMTALMFSMEMWGFTNKARIAAEEAMKLAEERLPSYRRGDGYHELGEAEFDAIVEQALIAAEEWRKVAAVFQKASGRKGVHLSAVGE